MIGKVYINFNNLMRYIRFEVSKGSKHIMAVYISEEEKLQVQEDADYFLVSWGIGNRVSLFIEETIPKASKNTNSSPLKKKAFLLKLESI
nr:hypothetical protein [Neobacillus sp. Marseille-Q6967]